MQLFLIQMLHHFADILLLVERGDEQGVFGLDNHQVAHADQGDEFAEHVNIIVLRVQGKSAGRGRQIPAATFCLCYAVLMQRSPGAEVVPSEVGGQTEDAGLRFSLGRSRLQHRIVDADVFAPRIQLSKSVRELARAISGCNFFEKESGLGKMLAQRVRECVGAPEKHAAVPEVVARVEKLPGQAKIRLLREAAHAQRQSPLAIERALLGRSSLGRTGFNIAIAGFGASRADAEHNDVFSRCGNLDSFGESSAVLGGVVDDVIGGKQTKHRLGIVAKQEKCRQTNGGRCIASGRLGDDLLRMKLRKLMKDGGTQVVVRNDPEPARRSHRCEARDGLLNHGLLSIEGKQLLGAALAAQRPEARASTTSEDYRIEVWVRLHCLRSLPFARRAAKSSPQGAQGITGGELGAINLCLPCASLCSLW